jgi:ribonuclease HI
MMRVNFWNLYTDGAARGNPGPASAAWCLRSGDEIHLRDGVYLGYSTNNAAEYSALIHGLTASSEFGIKTMTVHSDSELMIRQLEGTYEIRSPRLLPLYRQAKELLRQFSPVTLVHLRRCDPGIRDVDALCNAILDEQNEKGG